MILRPTCLTLHPNVPREKDTEKQQDSIWPPTMNNNRRTVLMEYQRLKSAGTSIHGLVCLLAYLYSGERDPTVHTSQSPLLSYRWIWVLPTAPSASLESGLFNCLLCTLQCVLGSRIRLDLRRNGRNEELQFCRHPLNHPGSWSFRGHAALLSSTRAWVCLALLPWFPKPPRPGSSSLPSPPCPMLQSSPGLKSCPWLSTCPLPFSQIILVQCFLFSNPDPQPGSAWMSYFQ